MGEGKRRCRRAPQDKGAGGVHKGNFHIPTASDGKKNQHIYHSYTTTAWWLSTLTCNEHSSNSKWRSPEAEMICVIRTAKFVPRGSIPLSKIKPPEAATESSRAPVPSWWTMYSTWFLSRLILDSGLNLSILGRHAFCSVVLSFFLYFFLGCEEPN